MQQNSIFSSLRQALIYTLTAIGLILFIVMAMTAVATSKDKQFVNGKQHQPFVPYRLTGQMVGLPASSFSGSDGLSQQMVTAAHVTTDSPSQTVTSDISPGPDDKATTHPAVEVTAGGRHQYQARNIQAMIQQARHRHQL